jgi:hypothetical protein
MADLPTMTTMFPRKSAWLSILTALAAAGCGSDDGTWLDAGATSYDGAPATETNPAPDGLPGDALPPGADTTPPSAADAGTPGTPGALYGADPFSIVLLPDTQFYVQSYPEMFQAQAEWIAAQKDALKLAFVLHLGDIVETPSLPAEWTRADGTMATLDAAKVPYAVCAGNHDIDVRTRAATLMNQTFPQPRLSPQLQATFEPGKIEDAYYFFPAGGRTWLVVSLEFGPRDEVLTWADGIIAANADKPTIILTHAYMYLGQQRYDHLLHPDPVQYWNPHGYGLPGTTNDGQEIWDKLVSKHDNILFVFSGHATWPEGAAGRISTKRANGYYVNEMLSNYQGCPSDYMCTNRVTNQPVRGGEGMLRIVHVDPAAQKARVETYSPYLDKTVCQPAFSSCAAAHHAEPEHTFEVPLQ